MNRTAVALGVIAAMVVLIIYSVNLTVIQWPAEQTKNHEWTQQAKESPKNFLLICPPSEKGKPIPAEKCERHGQYENDRNHQIADHKAQVSMRNAAWLTAFLTLGGMILIGFTLDQARGAATLARKVLDEAKTATEVAQEGLVEARKATIAAKESVSVTRDMGVAQTRAYIVIKRADILIPDKSGWPIGAENSHHFWARALLENIGGTPAHSVRYKTKVVIREQRKIPNASGYRHFAVVDTGFGSYGPTFGSIPHKSNTGKSGNITTHKAPSIGKTIPLTFEVSVTVRCEYKDVFDNEWFTESTFSRHNLIGKSDWFTGLNQEFRLDKNGKI